MAKRPSAQAALGALVGLAIAAGACAPAQPARSGPAEPAAPGQAAPASGAAAAGAPAAPGSSGDLAACPARGAVLRVGGQLGNETFSAHPMENRFTSTLFSRLHQLPLFGADPQETRLDAAYGAAESWEFQNDAQTLHVTLHDGLTFNNGTPVTAEDVAFSIDLAASDFADPQLSGVMRAFGAKGEVLGERELLIHFKGGAVTFPTELSPLVYPLYVVSKSYHSDGAITQEAVDAFREQPQAAGPYEVVSREVQKGITLKAVRKDPLLGCPTYDRIEIKNIPEAGTRMAQLQTGQLDMAEGNRDLIDQAKVFGARVTSKPAANLIGLYFFQTHLPDNVFRDVRLRLAATYAIDHPTLAKTIWKDVGVTPWGCTWPPPAEISTQESAYMATCATPYPYDPAKARELLAQAGYGPQNRPKIGLTFWNNYPEEADLAQAMQPMLNAVGFDAQIDRIDRAEYERRRTGEGMANSIMFFGPGDRATALAGAYSVYGPSQGLGSKDDPDMAAALGRAAGAKSAADYRKAMVDIAKLAKERPYGPGFFAAGSIWFVNAKLPDWGLEQDKGRSPLNLSALVTKRS